MRLVNFFFYQIKPTEQNQHNFLISNHAQKEKKKNFIVILKWVNWNALDLLSIILQNMLT